MGGKSFSSSSFSSSSFSSSSSVTKHVIYGKPNLRTSFKMATFKFNYTPQRLYTRNGVPVIPNWYDKLWRKINEKRR